MAGRKKRRWRGYVPQIAPTKRCRPTRRKHHIKEPADLHNQSGAQRSWPSSCSNDRLQNRTLKRSAPCWSHAVTNLCTLASRLEGGAATGHAQHLARKPICCASVAPAAVIRSTRGEYEVRTFTGGSA